MMKIGVLFRFTTLLFFNSGIQAKSLVDEMKIGRDENSKRQQPYQENNNGLVYGSNVGRNPMYGINYYQPQMMKRSSIEPRQTGIIYGDGKPIGILQPYQESFKFVPLKEEEVLAMEKNGGRSSFQQQQQPSVSYLKLMSPMMSRFVRSESAARSEFLEKHYPSMLVDFKIHNKLHPIAIDNNGQTTNENNLNKRDDRDLQNVNNKKKRTNIVVNQLKAQKRDVDVDQRKKENEEIKNRQVSKRGLETKRDMRKNLEETAQKKRKVEENQERSKFTRKREEKKRRMDSPQRSEATGKVDSKRNIKSDSRRKKQIKQNEKNKREKGLTDIEFKKLKSAMEKKRHTQVIEGDLKNLLNDMGLMEEDAGIKDDNLHKRHSDREQIKERERRDEIDFKKISFNPKIVSQHNMNDIEDANDDDDDEVSTVTEASAESSFVIPNKRDVSKEKKDPMNKIASKSETYEDYEQRVAREIKEKIAQLKEEVKRELGALEEDKDNKEEEEDEEEDEEEERGSFGGEPQRRKRFVAKNTLIDEENHNINPNANVDGLEMLEPHVRRRRMLSIDDNMSPSFDDYENERRNIDSEEDEEKQQVAAENNEKSDVKRKPIKQQQYAPENLQNFNQKLYYYLSNNNERENNDFYTGSNAKISGAYNYRNKYSKDYLRNSYYNSKLNNHYYGDNKNYLGKKDAIYKQIKRSFDMNDVERNRKRKHTTKNVLIPSRKMEEAIVTNLSPKLLSRTMKKKSTREKEGNPEKPTTITIIPIEKDEDERKTKGKFKKKRKIISSYDTRSSDVILPEHHLQNLRFSDRHPKFSSEKQANYCEMENFGKNKSGSENVRIFRLKGAIVNASLLTTTDVMKPKYNDKKPCEFLIKNNVTRENENDNMKTTKKNEKDNNLTEEIIIKSAMEKLNEKDKKSCRNERRKRETTKFDREKRSLEWFRPFKFFQNPNVEDEEEEENSEPSKRNDDAVEEKEDDFDMENEGGFVEREKRLIDDSVDYDRSKQRRKSSVKGKFEDEIEIVPHQKQQLLSEMNENDLFGALPQSYAGELTRYKRVKKNNNNKRDGQ